MLMEMLRFNENTDPLENLWDNGKYSLNHRSKSLAPPLVTVRRTVCNKLPVTMSSLIVFLISNALIVFLSIAMTSNCREGG